jgi:hypothetical protein
MGSFFFSSLKYWIAGSKLSSVPPRAMFTATAAEYPTAAEWG